MTLARRETAYQTFYNTALCRQVLAQLRVHGFVTKPKVDRHKN